MEFGCIPISNSLQVIHKEECSILEQASTMFKSGMGFPPSSACGNKTSCFFQCLDDHEYCMMVILSAFLLPVAKIVKLIHPRITKMGFALESAMLSNSYPNLPTEASPYIGVSFFNTRRRPPLSDPYLPKNRSNELIWEPTPEVGKRNKKPPRFLQSSNDESCR